jgi:hypothetical protein
VTIFACDFSVFTTYIAIAFGNFTTSFWELACDCNLTAVAIIVVSNVVVITKTAVDKKIIFVRAV